MHGTTIKIINAQKARLNNIYKNTNLKLLKVNAAIWFNKICREKIIYAHNFRHNNTNSTHAHKNS
jgi:hypothetical protein